MLLLRSFAVSLALASAVACQDPTEPSEASEMPIRLVNAFPKQEKFKQPLYVGFHSSDPDYAYVVEQEGTVWRVARDADSNERLPFLEWKDKAFFGANWEEGLLGFAFDPNYADNQFVYIYYTEKVSGQGKRAKRRSVVSRLTKVDGFAGPTVMHDSELRILEVDQPYGNHNGGTIEFGPDGMLYIVLGDGGRANDPHGNSQDLSTLLGSILRIDVRGANKAKPYKVPADNPFVETEGARGEIFAYGLRNPWRISFDRETGDLWCGDVGQNQTEEVDRIVKGGNYGWNAREGDHAFEATRGPKPGGEAAADAKFLEPIATYGRNDGGSITGGYVYRGQAIPELVGRFVYADFMTGKMWCVREDRNGGKHEVTKLPKACSSPSSFAQEPDGELLVCSLYGGKIFRIVPAGE